MGKLSSSIPGILPQTRSSILVMFYSIWSLFPSRCPPLTSPPGASVQLGWFVLKTLVVSSWLLRRASPTLWPSLFSLLPQILPILQGLGHTLPAPGSHPCFLHCWVHGALSDPLACFTLCHVCVIIHIVFDIPRLYISSLLFGCLSLRTESASHMSLQPLRLEDATQYVVGAQWTGKH